METLNEQARRLSSGTMATLTGLRLYVDIDIVRAEFVSFCNTLAEPPDKWQSAWVQFKEYREPGSSGCLRP